jgi:hypothetical protein
MRQDGSAARPVVVRPTFKMPPLLEGGRKSQRLGGFEIDPQSEVRRLHDRQVGGFFPSQNTGDIDTGLPVQVAGVRTVADQAASCGESGGRHHCGQSVLPSQGDTLRLSRSIVKERIDMDQ